MTHTSAMQKAREVAEEAYDSLARGYDLEGLARDDVVSAIAAAIISETAANDALLKEAVKALRPFAEESDEWWKKTSSRSRPKVLEPQSRQGEKAKFTVGDLRRARAFLDKIGGR